MAPALRSSARVIVTVQTPSGDVAPASTFGAPTSARARPVTPHVKTMYHVVASTSPETVSPDLLEKARSCARLHVSDPTPKRGQLVRFFGTVIPAKDGRTLRLYEPGPFGERIVAKTKLRHNNARSSKFSLTWHVRKSGAYGVSVPADAANEHGGGFITLHVHR